MFLVVVQDLFAEPGSPEEVFDNCYFFCSDGTWDDPLFPVPGAFNLDSVGAKTSYTANSLVVDLDIGVVVDLSREQVVKVTPAHGRGNLQLTAFSQAFLRNFISGDDLLVGECPL